MNFKKQRAGQLGGLTTLMKYGNSHFKEIGQLGGRPKRQQIALEVGNNHKGGIPYTGLPNSLKKLKELYELQNKSGGSLTES